MFVDCDNCWLLEHYGLIVLCYVIDSFCCCFIVLRLVFDLGCLCDLDYLSILCLVICDSLCYIV